MWKRFDNEVQNLKNQKQELSAEFSQIEAEEFKAFCKKAKVKSVVEYEEKLHQGLPLDNDRDLTAEQLNSRKIPDTEQALL